MNEHIDHSRIPGWGADLNPRDRPGVPMERTPREGVRAAAPPQQAPMIEVLRSIERPGITPVFGTSCPPSGLSGVIRRRAFKRSENDMRHWMLLLVADRVNVVEGLLQDARRSPRARSAAVAAVAVASAWWLLRRR